MAYANASPHNIAHHRRPKNVATLFELEKPSSPPTIFRRRSSSHRNKCKSMSSFSTLSTNSTTSSSSLSSNNNFQENHMFNNQNINTNPITSSPSTSFPSRIPFSWEKLPGIPKQQIQDSKKKLPLPPGVVTTEKTSSCNRQKNRDNNNNQAYSSRRYSMCSSEEMMGTFLEDPFFMAMVECSKDKNRRESTTKMVAKRTRSSRGGRKSISSIVTSHLSDGIGMMNMYGSCKSSCNVSESSTVRLPSTTTYTETLYGLGRDRGCDRDCR